MHLNGFLCELLDTREYPSPPSTPPAPRSPCTVKTHASHDYYYYSCCARALQSAQQQKLQGKPLAIHLRASSRCLCLQLDWASISLSLCLTYTCTLSPSRPISSWVHCCKPGQKLGAWRGQRQVNFLNTLTAICEICCRQSARK